MLVEDVESLRQRFRELRGRFPQAESASRVLALQGVFVALQRAAGAHESQQESQPMSLVGPA